MIEAMAKLQMRAIFHISITDRYLVEEIIAKNPIDKDQIFILDKPVSHAALFALCSVIAHHGGKE